MKILVACEFSGKVREAFAKYGHWVLSCDYLLTTQPCSIRTRHKQDNVLNHLYKNWDMLIAFPPCTHLCVSGARWWHEKENEQKEALLFVKELLNAPIPKIVLENPIGKISTAIRKPDQILQPWQFGHGEVKSTCLWLKNLPKLIPTCIVPGRDPKCWKMPPSIDRGLKRSITYQGIANAMAEQWGKDG